MTDQYAIVSFTTPASNSLFSVTSVDITEPFSAAFFIWHSNTTDGADNNHGVIGFGACSPNGAAAADRSAGFCMIGDNDSDRTLPEYDTERSAGDTTPGCIVVNDGSTQAKVIEARFNASVAGGVQLNFATVTGGAQVKCTALLLAGLSNSGVGTDSTNTSSSEQTGASPFFTPDVLAFFGGGNTPNVQSDDSQGNLGFAVRGGDTVSAFINHNRDTPAEPTDADGEVSSDSAMSGHTAEVRTALHGDLDSFNSDGFTWTAREGSTVTTMYAALKFSGTYQAACAAMPIAASTGDQSFTGFGFTPSVVVGMVLPITSLDTYTSGNDAGACGFFIFSASAARAVTEHGEVGKTNVAAASFNTRNRGEEVALLLYNHTGTIIQRATWNGGTSGGFVLNFSAASAAGYMVALGIQLGATNLVSNDTETITDAAVLHGTQALVANETEEVSDVALLFPYDTPPSGAPAGWSYIAGAERGANLHAGAVQGIVL